eukprot:176419_1
MAHLVELETDNRASVVSAIDNQDTAGHGGHDVDCNDSSYGNIKFMSMLAFWSGVGCICITIVKCIFELVIHATTNARTFNGTTLNDINTMDICSFVVVGIALFTWITQRVPLCKFDLLWKNIAICLSHHSRDSSHCIMHGQFYCIVDGLMKITFVKMVRRLFIGICSLCLWEFYYRF